MKFKIKTIEVDGRELTHFYLNEKDISDIVTGFRIEAKNSDPLVVSIDFSERIDFESTDLKLLSQENDEKCWRYCYIEQRKKPVQKKLKGLLQKLKQKG